jgi:branched-chain amino acid transport system substrate-binding protein
MERIYLKLFLVVTLSIIIATSSIGFAQEPIKIGSTLSLSGGYAGTGVALKHGIMFAQHRINEGGGVLGRKIEILIIDNESKPALANTIAKRLVTVDRTSVIIPATGSPIANAVAPVCEEFKVPMLSIFSGDPKLHIPVRPFIFQYYPDTIAHSNVLALRLKRLNLRKTTLVYIDNAWGRGVRDLMMQEDFKKRYGYEFVAEPIPVPADVKDMTVQVGRLKATPGIEAVLLAPTTPVMTAFLKARKIANWDIEAIVWGPYVEEALVVIGAPDYGYKAWQATPYDPTGNLKAISRTVPEEAIKYFGGKKWAMDDCFACGYDGLMITAEAIKRAGSDDPNKIRNSLENNLKNWGKGILIQGNAETIIRWSPEYHGGLQPEEVVWQHWIDGKPKTVGN